jgi:hypothetical protein
MGAIGLIRENYICGYNVSPALIWGFEPEFEAVLCL